MKKKSSLLRACCVCGVLLLTIGLAYRGYGRHLREYIARSAFVTLTEMAHQQTLYISDGLAADGRSLSNLALSVGLEDDPIERETRLERLRQNSHFETLDFYGLNGRHLWGGNQSLRLPAHISQDGKLPVGVIYYSLTPTTPTSILMCTPVFDRLGVRLGTLAGVHGTQLLSHSLLPFFEGSGFTYLLSGERQLIAARLGDSGVPIESDSWNDLRTAEHIAGHTVAQMEENISNGESGSAVLALDSTRYFVHYQPVGINDWSILTTVNQAEVSRRADLAMVSGMGVFVSILFALLLLMLYMLWQQFRHEKALRHAALYDEFCNCPNLASFRMSAQSVMDERGDRMLLMIKLDIDRFKLVNQILGTEMGDRVLQTMAAALRQNANGDERRFARAHDDTFYILHCYRTQAELKALKHGFFNRFSELMGPDFHYSLRFVSGVYYVSLENCTSAAEAIEKATIAHRRAKSTGVALCNYDETFVNQALRRREIEERMEAALEQGEFHVYLQAQHSLSTNHISGAEALVRWHDGNESILPDEFIPIFEENNFVLRLDLHVFETVCRFVRQWMDSGLEPVPVSVNFARNHLADPDFAIRLREIADRHRVPRHLLGVELTERVIAQDEIVSLQFFEELCECGFTVSMDDFGTGYSSLGLLKNIPVDVIKLDKSFFARAGDQPRALAVLTNVIQLAKDLNALTIAEGVETEETATMLRDFGCDAAQGYFFARPMPEPDFRALLDARQEAASPVSTSGG